MSLDIQAELADLRQQVETLRRERDDLETMLEMTTEHSDTVEEELHSRAEAALRRSEQQLRMIVEATPVPVIITRLADGIIVYANAMAGPLVGLATEEVLGREAISFYDKPEEGRVLLDRLAEQGAVDHYELHLKKVDSTPLWVEISLRLLDFNDEPAILVTLHDITERKQAFEASIRFVPVEILEFFKKRSLMELELGEHISDEMTVMFSDVRSFTTISETMTPQENFGFVNAYLGRVSPIIRDHHGFILKYLGDGIMAVFPNSADDGVRAAIDKLKRVTDYNRERQKKGYLPIALGIGLNTGHLMVGMVGEANRIQGDAFSDDVNLSSRVESLTKFYHVSLIITGETYRALADPSEYYLRFLDRVQVKGRSQPVDLYEVYSADPPQLLRLKKSTQVDYDQALSHYYKKEFTAAQALLFKVLQRNPQDKVAWHHLVQATRLVDEGVANDWTGVTVMTQK
jgi:PAS domain S-box-containing protein